MALCVCRNINEDFSVIIKKLLSSTGGPSLVRFLGTEKIVLCNIRTSWD
jgi:hypothetical protein